MPSVVRDVPTLLELGLVPTASLLVSEVRPVLTVPVLVVPTRDPVTIRPLASRLIPVRDDVEVRAVPTVDVRRLVVPTRLLKRSLVSERTEDPVGRIA